MRTLLHRFICADWVTKGLVSFMLFDTVLVIAMDASVHFHNWPIMLGGCAIFLSAAGALLEGV